MMRRILAIVLCSLTIHAARSSINHRNIKIINKRLSWDKRPAHVSSSKLPAENEAVLFGKPAHAQRILQHDSSHTSNSVQNVSASNPPAHKALSPVAATDIILFVLSFLVLSLAAGAGIGGGVLIVPMLSLITGFDPIQTVALSNLILLAGAVSNMAFNLPRKNPVKPGPLIDYDMLLLFGPPIVMGSIAGSYINYFVPGWVTKFLVLLVLVPMTWRMINRAKMLWAADTKMIHRKLPTMACQPSTSLQSSDSNTRASPPAGSPDTSSIVHASTSKGADAAQTNSVCSVSVAARSSVSSCVPHHPNSPQPCHSSINHHRPLPRLVKSFSHTLRHQVSLGRALSSQQNSLPDLLGPELVLLTTPEAAAAAVNTQAVNRAASLKQCSSCGSKKSSFADQQESSGHLDTSGSFASVSSSGRWGHGHMHAAGHDVDALTDIDSEASLHFDETTKSDLLLTPFQLHQQQWKDDTTAAAQQQQHQEHTAPAGHLQPLQHQLKGAGQLPEHGQLSCRRLLHTGCLHHPDLEGRMMKKMEHHAEAQVPKAHFGGLLLMLAAVVITGVSGQLLLTCGTWQYWVVVLAPLPLMLLVWGLMRWHVLWRVGWQECLGMAHATDIHWTPTSTLTYPAICISVGLMAGMLGLGGGSVLAPLLLELRVQPAVSAASSQAAMLLSSCSSAVVYLVNGAVPPDYGITLAVIGLTGTLFGQVVVNFVVQKTGRSSILVLILAGLFVLASAAAVAVLGTAVAGIVSNPAKLAATHHLEICRLKTGRQ